MKKRRRIHAKSELLIIAIVTVIIIAASVFFIFGFNRSETGRNTDLVNNEQDRQTANPDNINTTYPAGGTHNENPPANTPELVQHPASDKVLIIDIATANSQLYKELIAESESHNAAAVSLVVYDGYAGTFHTYQYGYSSIEENRQVNLNTKYRVASLSKLVTVICAMILADEGKLDLDEDISVYLGYNVKNPGFTNTQITSRMLMQHTSSIFDSQAFENSILRSVNQPVSTQTLLSGNSSFSHSRPGTVFTYSNFAYSILGAIIELITETKLDAFVNEKLFKPLDIDAAFLPSNIKDTENIAALYNTNHAVVRSINLQLNDITVKGLGEDQHLAQGGLVISAIDYAKILAMLGNGGTIFGERILSGESVAQIHNANVQGPSYKQGLATRFTAGGRDESALNMRVSDQPLWRLQDKEDFVTWQYMIENGSYITNDGFYWHTGTGYGIFAQYIKPASSGTNEGAGGQFTSRGIVVITTGAWSGRASNGTIDFCNHLSSIAWTGLAYDYK